MKYFVLSDGENPTQLFFDEEIAKEKGRDVCNAYIDAFDENGIHVKVWHLVDDKTGTGEMIWTTDF